MDKSEGRDTAVLFLEDGSLLLGSGFGAQNTVVGEVVFNTGMVGYPESMTDPSYAGQILCFTYPLIGNYGAGGDTDRDVYGLPKQFESDAIKVGGIIVEEECLRPSHWTSGKVLSDWMSDAGVPGISGIDTRALVTKLRVRGVMMGVISNRSDPMSKKEASELLRRASRYDAVDYVRRVSTREEKKYGDSDRRIVLVDCGVKFSILRNILDRGYSVVRVPHDYSYSQIMRHDPLGVVISNGPGDPKLCTQTIETTGRLIDSEVPLLGVCLGEQLIGLSQGAETYKLKYGHRGQNKPVVDLTSKRGYVTSQNHGYSIDPKSLSKTDLKAWFVNADDGTVEGVVHAARPCISVQFHPEASPGPYDTEFVFDRFAELVREQKVRKFEA